MTTPNYIPGYAVQPLVGNADTTIGLTAMSYDVNGGPNQIEKRRLGATSQDALAGQFSGTVSASGHCTDENLPTLAGLQTATGQPIEIVATLNAAGAKHAYSCVADIGYSVRGDGELDWSIDGAINGEITFTPAGG